MVILRKLYAVPGSKDLKAPLEEAKKDNNKFLQNLQRQGLNQNTPVHPVGDMRPGVVSAPKPPSFSNGADDDSLPEEEIDITYGDEEDF